MDEREQKSEGVPSAENAEENPYASPHVASTGVHYPPLPEGRPVSLIAKAGILLAVIVSAFAAFCCTCFPIGAAAVNIEPFAGIGIIVAIAVGVGTAVFVGLWVARQLMRWARGS